MGAVGNEETPLRIDEGKEQDMKTMLEKLENLFAAISFAEAGEHDTAKSVMERQDRAANVRRFCGYRDTTITHSGHPTRRAA